AIARLDAGTALVDGAGASMQEIERAVSQAEAIMASIADASRDQAIGIGEVTRAVAHLDGITHRNLTMVQEAAIATDGQERQAASLTKTLLAFRLNTESPDGLRAATAHPARATTVTRSRGAQSGHLLYAETDQAAVAGYA